MTVSYKKLWHILVEREMLKKDLSVLSGVSKGTLTKLVKNETVNLEVLLKICEALHCDIGDIVQALPESVSDSGEQPDK